MTNHEPADPGSRQAQPERPCWALPALLIGVACSLVVAWGSIDFAAGQAGGASPSIAMVYTIWMAPFLLVGVPCLLIGAWAVVRPWSMRRRWLPWAAVGAGVLWFLLVMGGPGWLGPDATRSGNGTVDGLPGQVAPWSGVVECEHAGDAITGVTASVPVDGSGGTTTFGVDLVLGDGDAAMIVGDAAIGGGSYASADRFEASDDRVGGTMVAMVQGILHRDAPISVVTVTWDCGPALAAP